MINQNELREIKVKLPFRLQRVSLAELEWWSIEKDMPIVFNDGEAYAILATFYSNDEKGEME